MLIAKLSGTYFRPSFVSQVREC